MPVYRLGFLLVLLPLLARAADEEFVAYPPSVYAIAGVSLVDGSGAPARPCQTILIENETIRSIADCGSTALPETTTVIDGRGKTLLPGFVLMHEHMFYPTGNSNYTEMLSSFPWPAGSLPCALPAPRHPVPT